MGLGRCDRYAPGYPPCVEARASAVVWYPHRDAPALLGGAPYRMQARNQTPLPDQELP